MLGNNMFAYCSNNPANMYDPNGTCSRFLGFLWRVDCKQASCKTSKNYIAPKGIDPVATFYNGDGYVYIIMPDQLDAIGKNIEDNAVIIVDYRLSNCTNEYDQNMQIRNSYRITDTMLQAQIVQIMQQYNLNNPVTPAWSRSTKSLIEEWQLHNLAYSFGVMRKSTAHCDFNNDDEGKRLWDFFTERVIP